MAPVIHSTVNALSLRDFSSPVHPLSSKNEVWIPFGQYVFERLISAGTKSVFGVPGDFNLSLLEHMYSRTVQRKGLKWFGTCNELNAAYAADGYSRYTNKIGCVITTYGVGELSAINGVAGAFAEDVKVLHIVGVTPSKFRNDETFIHHNVHHLIPAMDNPNFRGPNHRSYHDMIDGRISCSTEFVDSVDQACDQLDKVVNDIYKYSKPGYIFIPADFADKMVNAQNLITTPTITLENVISQGFNQEVVDSMATKIIDLLYKSKTPAVIGDVLCDRFGCVNEIRNFVRITKMWAFSSFMGRSILDESEPNFHGVYNGAESSPHIIQAIDSCDLILHFGVLKNEINNGHYSFSFNANATEVELHSDYLNFVDYKSGNEVLVKGVHFVSVLNRIIQLIDVTKINLKYPDLTVNPEMATPAGIHSPESQITQKFLQNAMSEYLSPGDVFVVETGSFQFVVRDFQFPTNVKYISQGFYLSIGMALPSCLGIGCAMKDYPGSHICDAEVSTLDYTPKLILCEGDGAAQMTIQELTSFLRYQIPVEIFLWNNHGYTVERAIRGPTRPYNDIMEWKWTKLLEAFGDFDGSISEACRVKNVGEFKDVVSSLKHSKERSKVRLIEVMLGMMDIPKQLLAMASACQHE